MLATYALTLVMVFIFTIQRFLTNVKTSTLNIAVKDEVTFFPTTVAAFTGALLSGWSLALPASFLRDTRTFSTANFSTGAHLRLTSAAV